MSDVHGDLRARRRDVVRAWTQSVERGVATATPDGRPEILLSWDRSGEAVTPDLMAAPMDDESDTKAYFRGSPLQVAVERVEDELRRTAEDGDLVLALTDDETRILWTYGGRVMRRKAETVNFGAGARWDEQSVGTNALCLAGAGTTSRSAPTPSTWPTGCSSRRWSSAPSTTRRSCTTGCVGRPPC